MATPDPEPDTPALSRAATITRLVVLAVVLGSVDLIVMFAMGAPVADRRSRPGATTWMPSRSAEGRTEGSTP